MVICSFSAGMIERGGNKIYLDSISTENLCIYHLSTHSHFRNGHRKFCSHLFLELKVITTRVYHCELKATRGGCLFSSRSRLRPKLSLSCYVLLHPCCPVESVVYRGRIESGT